MMTWIDQLQPANWNRASGIALASYILGCFTTGFYYVRLRTEQDIRDLGSGSVGAKNVGRVLGWMPATALARAGSGVCYGYFPQAVDLTLFTDYGPGAVIEFAPQHFREQADLWPSPGSDFEMMKKIKDMFDPRSLLNRGRLYGRI